MDTIFHADDYGICPDQARLILSCGTACGGTGALNSVSVMANSPSFEECADLLDPHLDGIRTALHLNLVEGPCCAPTEKVRLLVDSRGFFKRDFAELLSMSLAPDRQLLNNQLKIEIGAQIDRFLERWPRFEGSLRIDSHQHMHMIPLVFEATMEAIDARGADLEYLRIPQEPLEPFLANPRTMLGIPAVNWVKRNLLASLWRIDRKSFPTYQDHSGIFCGIFLSGRMCLDRIEPVLPAFRLLAEKRGMPLEVLFHPGGLAIDASCLDPRLSGFTSFYRSPNRQAENEALAHLAPTDKPEGASESGLQADRGHAPSA